jgi:hypothetical protein
VSRASGFFFENTVYFIHDDFQFGGILIVDRLLAQLMPESSFFGEHGIVPLPIILTPML